MEKYQSHIISVCNKDGGTKCCRYLLTNGTFFECGKIEKPEGFSPQPDAQGDNCIGTTSLSRIEKAIIYMNETKEILEKNSKK